MQNRLIRATLDLGRREASRSAALALVLRDTVSGFFTTARHMLMTIGLLALCLTGLVLVKPEFAERALSMVSISEDEQSWDPALDEPLAAALLPLPAANAGIAPELVAAELNEELLHQQQRVTTWIARRYRVASDATQLFVTTAYSTAKDLKLDPFQ